MLLLVDLVSSSSSSILFVYFICTVLEWIEYLIGWVCEVVVVVVVA